MAGLRAKHKADRHQRIVEAAARLFRAQGYDTVKMEAIAAAEGLPDGYLEVILHQFVNLYRSGEAVRMSKRTGEIITFDELLDEVGADAARYTLLSRSTDTALDFDIELVTRQSLDNPVYYVQYAHARIASILRKAAEADLVPAASLAGSLDTASPEAALARVVARLPEVVEDAAAAQETQGITTYATELATAFHAFYRDARVIDVDEPERSAKRLALVDATRISLANALALLGISAPEAM